MIKIKQAIIVEGKYDKIKLSSLVEAVIIPTNGFGIYKDEEKKELIRSLAEKTGIIILTDSDSAGFRIRSHLRNIVKKGEIINVYIPDIFGKERRKAEPSKQGKLGVEGMSPEILLEAFRKAGVLADEASPKAAPITKADLMDLGLIGGENSAVLRKQLQRELGLPELLSANMLLEILNVMYSREEFISGYFEK
ncbi:MAG: toprim domain-containing protein [Oscillospiraceae bacterium]